jgi:hypothetical protein
MSAFPHLYHLVLRQELHGQIIQNGYWFRLRPGFEIFDEVTFTMASIRDSFLDNVLPKIEMFANTQLKIQGAVVSRVSPKNGPIVERLLETSGGVQPDDSLPSYCAGLLSLRTGLGGRGNRGRSYYAGVSEGDSSNSKLDADCLGRLQDVGDELLAHFGGPSFGVAQYGVWSWLKGRVGATSDEYNTTSGFTPITQAVARLPIATNRHRKIGHGT